MSKIKKKILAGVLAFAILAPTVANAAYVSYVGYSLPPFQKNNYTSYHKIKTNDDYIYNIVENISVDAKSVKFWAQWNGDKWSKKYTQKKGSSQKIEFDKNLDKGNKVRLAMENSSYNIKNYGFVAGRVDFR